MEPLEDPASRALQQEEPRSCGLRSEFQESTDCEFLGRHTVQLAGIDAFN